MMGEATETTPRPPSHPSVAKSVLPHDGAADSSAAPVSFASDARTLMLRIEREGQRVLAWMMLCAILALTLWLFGP
jgi:hypothetical protein